MVLGEGGDDDNRESSIVWGRNMGVTRVSDIITTMSLIAVNRSSPLCSTATAGPEATVVSSTPVTYVTI